VMFDKILVANRGEIAVRIVRAARELGVEVVVVYSEVDKDTLAVKLADQSVCIGPTAATKSYLSMPAIIGAANAYGAQAIHHSQLKVSKSGGDYTETQNIPFDGGLNYIFVDLGMTTEVVTYTHGKDNGVAQFIYDNQNTALKAEYLGGKKYSITISQGDKNALVKILDFSVILSDIERLKKEKEKSVQRIEYLQSKTN
jgi:hypothetical protein